MSVSLGTGSPDGWLCETMTDAAPIKSAFWNISLVGNSAMAWLPIEISVVPISLFFVFRHKRIACSPAY